MEEYLPVIVFSQISPDMKKRNHKSADCDRTVEYSKVAGRGEKSGRDPEGKRKYRGSLEIFFCRKRQIYEQAEKETDGQVLTYEGKVRLTPWHKRSAGKTRSGEEAFMMRRIHI